MARISIDISSGKLKEPNKYYGIDLGTTNSLIAKVEDGVPVAISDYNKPVIVPSVLHFQRHGGIVVGDEAIPYLQTDPEHTVYSIKRLMGRESADIEPHKAYFSYPIVQSSVDNLLKVPMYNQAYTAIELSAMILRELRQRAEHRLKTDIKNVVITVPAYFNDAQRQATRDAGRLAGLEVMRIVNEPTAAALAYGIGHDPTKQQTILVYDLGGGTFDVTVLKIEEGIFDVLSTAGDTYLGGDDLDRLIFEHWVNKAGLSMEAILSHKADSQSLRLLAEQAKRTLSFKHEFFGQWQSSLFGNQSFQLSREQLNQLILAIIQKTIHLAHQAVKDAGLKTSDIDEIILVGGSTRTPLIKQLLEEQFGKKPLDHLNPDEVVALGAAIQADILAGNRKDLLLLDVTPLSLGIETIGGLMDVLIQRNSKIPSRVSRQYTTSVDGQSKLKVAVYQGEREQVEHNRKLAEFDLTNIPAMPAGIPKIEIQFTLDADGILKVSAKETRSGVQQSIEVKPQYGLTDQQVEEMLMASFQHAQQDMEKRLLLETIGKAKQLMYFTNKFLKANGSLFSAKDLTEVHSLLSVLTKSTETGDKSAIQANMDNLDAFTRPFAQQAMETAIQQAMVGKSI